MSNCIFSGEELDKQTKPEHVLHDALGGRKTTRRVICSRWNNKLGGTIDRRFVEQYAVVRNLLQMRSGTGDLAPMLRNLKSGSLPVNARGDGKLEIVAKPFTTTQRPDGSYEVQILAQSPEQIERLIPHIAAKIRLPEAQLRAQLAVAPIKMIERRPDTVPFRLTFGGPDAMRSVAKSCLVLWALKVGNDEVRHTRYKAARYFVRRGGREFNRARARLDSRPFSDLEGMSRAYGPVFNLIYVRSDASGRVVGHFTVCNMIGHQVLLAESGGAKNQKIGLISDPLDTKNWSDSAAEMFDLPFEWLDGPEHDLNMFRERISDVMRNYFEIGQRREMNRMMDSVFDEFGFGENDPIPPDKLQLILAEIGSRMAHQMTGVPFERIMTFEEMQKRFGGKA